MKITHFSGIAANQGIHNGYATTATAAGTTTLDQNAAGNQFFTGSTTQTVKLPPAQGIEGTLPLGYQITVTNLSSGVVTVQDSAAGAVTTVAAGARKIATLTANSTTAGTWSMT
jgi:hypothetical protein